MSLGRVRSITSSNQSTCQCWVPLKHVSYISKCRLRTVGEQSGNGNKEHASKANNKEQTSEISILLTMCVNRLRDRLHANLIDSRRRQKDLPRLPARVYCFGVRYCNRQPRQGTSCHDVNSHTLVAYTRTTSAKGCRRGTRRWRVF